MRRFGLNNGGRKFAAPDPRMMQEDSVPQLEPTEAFKREKLREYYAKQLDDVTRGKKVFEGVTENPMAQQALANALAVQVNQLMNGDIDKRVNAAFVDEFQKWLRGISCYNADKTKTPWGTARLVGDDIYAYLEQFVDKKFQFQAALAKLKLAPPDNIRAAWLYFKYIVAGLDPNGDAYLPEYGWLTDPKKLEEAVNEVGGRTVSIRGPQGAVPVERSTTSPGLPYPLPRQDEMLQADKKQGIDVCTRVLDEKQIVQPAPTQTLASIAANEEIQPAFTDASLAERLKHEEAITPGASSSSSFQGPPTGKEAAPIEGGGASLISTTASILGKALSTLTAGAQTVGSAALGALPTYEHDKKAADTEAVEAIAERNKRERIAAERARKEKEEKERKQREDVERARAASEAARKQKEEADVAAAVAAKQAEALAASQRTSPEKNLNLELEQHKEHVQKKVEYNTKRREWHGHPGVLSDQTHGLRLDLPAMFEFFMMPDAKSDFQYSWTIPGLQDTKMALERASIDFKASIDKKTKGTAYTADEHRMYKYITEMPLDKVSEAEKAAVLTGVAVEWRDLKVLRENLLSSLKRSFDAHDAGRPTAHAGAEKVKIRLKDHLVPGARKKK